MSVLVWSCKLPTLPEQCSNYIIWVLSFPVCAYSKSSIHIPLDTLFSCSFKEVRIARNSRKVGCNINVNSQYHLHPDNYLNIHRSASLAISIIVGTNNCCKQILPTNPMLFLYSGVLAIWEWCYLGLNTWVRLIMATVSTMWSYGAGKQAPPFHLMNPQRTYPSNKCIR